MKTYYIFRKADNYPVHKYFLETHAKQAMSALPPDEFEVKVYNSDTEEWEELPE